LLTIVVAVAHVLSLAQSSIRWRRASQPAAWPATWEVYYLPLLPAPSKIVPRGRKIALVYRPTLRQSSSKCKQQLSLSKSFTCVQNRTVYCLHKFVSFRISSSVSQQATKCLVLHSIKCLLNALRHLAHSNSEHACMKQSADVLQVASVYSTSKMHCRLAPR